MHTYQCANCGQRFEGGCYHPSDTPRDKYGRVAHSHRDNPIRFESEECRTAYEGRKP